MHRRQLLQYLAALVLIVAAICFVIALRKIQTAQAVFAEAELEHQRAKQALQRHKAAAEKHRAPQPALTDAEVLELARLRNEVTRLRKEQEAATAKPTTTAAVPVGTSEQAATKVISHSVTSSANLHLGHTIALGSWFSSTPGKQIMGFLTPELSGEGVMVATRIFEIPKSTLEQLGFNQFGNGATFTPDQFKGILQRAEQAEGTDILAMPRILTLSGREAEVAIRQRLADGTETGPIIRVTPTVDATRTAVRLDFKFELNQLPSTPPAKP
jgi:hypothetical protein